MRKINSDCVTVIVPIPDELLEEFMSVFAAEIREAEQSEIDEEIQPYESCDGEDVLAACSHVPKFILH